MAYKNIISRDKVAPLMKEGKMTSLAVRKKLKAKGK